MESVLHKLSFGIKISRLPVDPKPYGKKTDFFVTPIYHPNINEKGRICVSLWQKWVPTHNIATVILALIALLSHPNPDSRLNGPAGDLYKNKPEEYKKEAQRWTNKYAAHG